VTAPDDTARRERAYELLATRTLEPLSALEAAELDHLRAELPDVDPDELDRIAAELVLAELGEAGHPPLPPALRSRVETDADFYFALTHQDGTGSPPDSPAVGSSGPTGQPSDALDPQAAGDDRADGWPSGEGIPGVPTGGGSLAWLPRAVPWVAAAAAVVVAVVLASRPPETVVETREVPVEVPVEPPAPAPPPTPAEARAALLAEHPDTLTLPFAPGPDEAGAGVSGDVVWSPDAQKGFLRFRGLARNDPRIEQYQLWIFDAERDEQHPVDGGVFDVPEGGEVIVPIDAKLPVGDPTLFAVTVEPPGGVVVSDRERIAALAQPGEAS